MIVVVYVCIALALLAEAYLCWDFWQEEPAPDWARRVPPAEWLGQEDRIECDNGVLLTHPAFVCEGRPCSIHNPSDHPMVDFPLHWRSDRGLMERTCPHGVGHPDPDHLSWVERTRGDVAAEAEAVHGCDGCCYKPGPMVVGGWAIIVQPGGNGAQ